MAEELSINAGDKAQRYQSLLPQITALISDEEDPIANQANVIAALWQTFGFFWVGFYRVHGQELVLGPFQGPIACTRIAYGAGVCGSAWKQHKTLVVEDVDTFPGHIACASASRSEIVVPVMNKSGAVTHVLDIDSDQLAMFDSIDKEYLEKLAELIGDKI